MSDLWPWIALMLLGAFHGLNPAMGWLFAVAMGFQEQRLRGVLDALGPIALGHAIAIALVAVPVGLLGLAMPQPLLLTLGGLALLAFAGFKVATRFRHPRWVGLRVRRHELVLWSFLMATAHGAGLMLVPVLIRLRSATNSASAEHVGASGLADLSSGHAGHMSVAVSGNTNHLGVGSDAINPALAAAALHTAAMFLVMGVIAVLVYRKIGVEILRRAWINLDLIWIGVLVLAGSTTLVLGLRPLLTG